MQLIKTIAKKLRTTMKREPAPLPDILEGDVVTDRQGRMWLVQRTMMSPEGHPVCYVTNPYVTGRGCIPIGAYQLELYHRAPKELS